MKIKNPAIEIQFKFFKEQLDGNFNKLNNVLSKNGENVLEEALIIMETIGRIHNALIVLTTVSHSEKKKSKKVKHKKKNPKSVDNVPSQYLYTRTDHGINNMQTEEERNLHIGYTDDLHD